MGATLARLSCVLPFWQHGCGLGVVKRAAKDTRMIHLLRTLFFYVAIYKFHFSAEHIPGIRNMPCHVMILLPFPVSFLRWCLWRFQLWCWTWWWRFTQIGARRTGWSCSGALFSGPLPPHSQFLLFRYKAVCFLLPASASPSSPSFRSHIVSLCV